MDQPLFFALSIIILLFSVIIHEVMHGFAALRFGDRTAENAGRLTLNPIPHIDPIGTILLPALLIFTGSPILFGWAKPVPVNPFNFRDIRSGELWVSAAGVLTNFAIAVLAAVLLNILRPFDISPMFLAVLRFAAIINLILAIFNSFPIPPLDGSKILMSFLPTHLAAQFRSLERYGFLILIMLLFIPFGRTSLLGAILSFFLGIFQSILRI